MLSYILNKDEEIYIFGSCLKAPYAVYGMSYVTKVFKTFFSGLQGSYLRNIKNCFSF